MDVTNPGLVNVADQVVGRPDLSVNHLDVPLQTDDLVAAAAEGYPPAPASSTLLPTPTEVIVGEEVLPQPSQVRGTVPGVPPLYLPYPPGPGDVVVGESDVAQSGTSEFTVAGPRTSVQTNQNAASEREYVVTSVADADTGGPVVDPNVSVSGTFSYVLAGPTGKIRLASSAALPASLVDGVTMSVSCPSQPSYNTAGQASTVVSASGNFTAVSDAGGGKSTVSSPSYPVGPGVTTGSVVIMSGSAVSAYNGAHQVSDVVNLLGPFSSVKDLLGLAISVISPTALPAGLTAGKLVTLSGTYAGPHAVASVTSYAGTYDSASDAGGGVVTFHATSLPAGMANSQYVTLSGSVYSGTYLISNVTATTFDATVAYISTDSGGLASYTFSIVIPFTTDYSGTWSCRTFDVDVAYAGTASGSWIVANFDVPGTYVATASGTWQFYPTATTPTTRYLLGVTPADLTSLGVSIAGRPVTFADDTLTTADAGATRTLQYVGSGAMVLAKSDPSDVQPTLVTPQAGDRLYLYDQREGSQVFVEQLGTVTDYYPRQEPPVASPDTTSSMYDSQGTVDVSVGPQPGQPVLTSGTQVPTARNVNVADQSAVVGLPTNVFA